MECTVYRRPEYICMVTDQRPKNNSVFKKRRKLKVVVTLQLLGSETLETTYLWPANSLSHTAWPSPTQILHSCFTFSNPLQNQILHSFDQVPDYAVSCRYGVSHALSRLSAPNTVFSTVQFSSKSKFTHRNKALPGMTAFMSSVLSDL